MEHFTVFAFLIVFLSGSWTAFGIWQQYKVGGVPVLWSLFLYLLSFNLLVFGFFIAVYTQTNIIGDSPETYHPLIWVGSAVGVFVLETGYCGAMLRLGQELRQKSLSPVLKAIFSSAVILIAISYVIGSTLVIRDGSSRWMVSTHQAMSVLMLLGCGTALSVIITGRHPDLPEDRRQSARRLGWYLLGGFLILVVSTPLLDQEYLVGFSAGLLWLSHAPLQWLRRHSAPYRQQVTPEGAVQAIARLAVRYDITRREQEIMALIVEGKSNKEIADQLCISFSTVKNHIYNLFRRLEVTSRVQLMHQVMVEDTRDRISPS
ncbi:response regulator transcription factor [Gemmatimonadota bacterium]